MDIAFHMPNGILTVLCTYHTMELTVYFDSKNAEFFMHGKCMYCMQHTDIAESNPALFRKLSIDDWFDE